MQSWLNFTGKISSTFKTNRKGKFHYKQVVSKSHGSYKYFLRIGTKNLHITVQYLAEKITFKNEFSVYRVHQCFPFSDESTVVQ